ncbi:hypothetical protein GCM10027059_40860 [Myceligenerans halotolerans]
MRPPRRAAPVVGAVAALVSLTVVGCTAGGLPAPEPEPAVVGAVVTEEQERTIIARVAETVETATAGRDTKVLGTRTAGPARELRASQIEVARILADDERVTALPMSMQAVVLPSEPDWPRTSLAVSTPPDDGTVPMLYAFEQRSARDDYKLWAWVKLLRRATLPPFASTVTGTEAVAADDDSLAMTPAKAVSAYADLLSGDADSASADRFEDDDDFRALLRDQESAQKKADGWKASEGKYSFSAERNADLGVRGMRTVDGGAIVIGAIDSTQTIQLQEGACAEPSDDFATQQALLGDQDVTNLLRTRYLDVVALYVPPEGSGATLHLVGFEHVAVAAESAGEPADCD